MARKVFSSSRIWPPLATSDTQSAHERKQEAANNASAKPHSCLSCLACRHTHDLQHRLPAHQRGSIAGFAECTVVLTALITLDPC